MGKGLNKVTIIGNLGQDPEVRYTQGGSAVCNLRIAVNERRKVGEEWKDATEWFSVVVFGKTAENAGQYLAKGRQVAVDGRLQTRKWKTKEGTERETTEVIANEIIFLGGGGDGAQTKSRAGAHPDGPDAGTGVGEPLKPGAGDGFVDDDLPF